MNILTSPETISGIWCRYLQQLVLSSLPLLKDHFESSTWYGGSTRKVFPRTDRPCYVSSSFQFNRKKSFAQLLYCYFKANIVKTTLEIFLETTKYPVISWDYDWQLMQVSDKCIAASFKVKLIKNSLTAAITFATITEEGKWTIWNEGV